MARVETMLHDGVEQGLFPAAQAVVLHRGVRVLECAAGSADSNTLFDLASLTKVMSTTALFISRWSEGRLAPLAPLLRYFGAAKVAQRGATLGDLLLHRSGLPAFMPYFAEVLGRYPELLQPRADAELRSRARALTVALAAATEVEAGVGQRAVYSDVGFILLGEALAADAASPLDELFAEKVARPLGLSAAYRRLSQPRSGGAAIAPTGSVRPRDPAPGQEGLWVSGPQVASLPGEVDDDNAWVLDGVAGHAGLFGTAGDVARFGQEVLDGVGGQGLLGAAEVWTAAVAPDQKTPHSTRAMGFDTPSKEGYSSAGRYIGRGPRGAVGHTGFTGTSLWVDLDRQLVVALCTNRTYLGRHEVRIRDFRPAFHDAVVESLAGEKETYG